MAPRHGKTYFKLDVASVLCAFVNRHGKHLLFLGISGYEKIMTIFGDNNEGALMIKVCAFNSWFPIALAEIIIITFYRFEMIDRQPASEELLVQSLIASKQLCLRPSVKRTPSFLRSSRSAARRTYHNPVSATVATLINGLMVSYTVFFPRTIWRQLISRSDPGWSKTNADGASDYKLGRAGTKAY